MEVVRPLFNVVINNAYIKRTLRLCIERSDGVGPYEAKYRGTFMFGEIPSVGSTLALRVDPERPTHFEVSRDGSAASDDAPVTATGSDIADQLQEVAELHRAGALTDDEFRRGQTPHSRRRSHAQDVRASSLSGRF